MTRKLSCILLIDDDDTTNYVNTLLIEKAGCCEKVKAVTSGKEALEYLSSADSNADHAGPELILLDINMPVMNGWEFVERYNELLPEQRDNVLVWMLSTSDNPSDRERAKQLGTDGFMAKPLTVAKLIDLVNRHFA